MKCYKFFPFAFAITFVLFGCGVSSDRQKPPSSTADIQTTRLIHPSSGIGINGVVLPAGSKLVKKKAARPEFNEDASELYIINATMGDLESYFIDQLGKAGWSKVSSYPGFLFYENGLRKVGIIIPQDGQSFEIRGKSR